jgi:molybdenum-dependent DNA-binding transcriptional regulator ModE
VCKTFIGNRNRFLGPVVQTRCGGGGGGEERERGRRGVELFLKNRKRMVDGKALIAN